MPLFPDDWDPDAPAAEGALFGLPCAASDALCVVIPAPWEATCSYRRGTAGAPEAILRASAQVDLADVETGEPWRAGIAMEEVDPELAAWAAEALALAAPVIEAGGPSDAASHRAVARVDALAARRDDLLEHKVRDLLAARRIPAVLGGDHSVPLGAIRAAAARYPELGVLHVDAHADLREDYEGFRSSHASILRNVLALPGVSTLVQVGVRDLGRGEIACSEGDPRVRTWLDPEVAVRLSEGERWSEIAWEMLGPLPERVWITFDVDGLDPSLCPGTGTPVPGGLSWREATVLLRLLGRSGRRIVGFDLCECGTGAWDADVGARLLYKLAGWAIATHGRNG